MDDLSESIGKLLRDPDAMAGILSMAKSLGLGAAPPAGDAPPETAAESPAQAPEAPREEPPADAAADASPALAALLEAGVPSGKQAALLQALKPFLREDRREKLDRAVRAVRISHMAGAAIRTMGQK